MLLRVPGFLLRAGKLFSQFLPLLQLLRKLGGGERKGEEVKSLCYLFEGMLYQGLQLLTELVSSQSLQL